MKAFTFLRPRTTAAVARELARSKGVLHAGGVDLLDRMKEHVDEPSHVVALLDVPGRNAIVLGDDGSLRIGAGVTLAELAENSIVRRFVPALAETAGLAASPAIRHRATLGGNLAQRSRCGCYRVATFPCRKRGDASCPVLEATGVQETAAIFGNGLCASAHPSSIAPVVQAFDGVLDLVRESGSRSVPLRDLWRMPERGVAEDLAIAPDEVIVSVTIPPEPRTQRAGCEEVRQRAAFDWALVSCAARLVFDGAEPATATVVDARIVLGSVAPTPWAAHAAEAALRGAPADAARLTAAAKAATEGATPLAGNRTKVRLVEVAVRRALERAMGRPAGGAR